MKLFLTTVTLIFSLTNLGCQDVPDEQKVLFGNEVLLNEHLELLKGKRIGIVTNHAALLPNKVHLVDSLLSLGINVIKLFSPEHGIRGEYSAGQFISSATDEKTKLPVFSLYGDTKKPTTEMLNNIDLILYDIQDIGVRFYTYISTLYYVLEAATENDIPVIILDRPNPLNCIDIAGPTLEINFKSFVGIAPIPVVYGMTAGELANYFAENHLIVSKKPDVRVIKISGWKRSYYWKELNRLWIPPSPNIPDFETALVYPGTCFIEGTNIAEGRGTETPFLTIGAPFISSEDLISKLNLINIKGVSIEPANFTPAEIEGKAVNPKYEGVECNGIRITITDEDDFKPVDFSIYLIHSLLQLYPEQVKFNEQHFDRLAGTDKLRLELLSGKDPSNIIGAWQQDIEKFNLERKKHLLY
ncbi:MAG: DUF1343 domain-containing protein [Ignavibacterium sp.]|nr:MAG: DUF1343 domain-containing protein [Ignavibacterium sp.]